MADIYALLEPETRKIRYVGSTTNITDRLRLHWSQRAWRKTRVAEWLRTLDEVPEFEILQVVPDEQRWMAEEYWTRLLMQIDPVDLLNAHPGTKVNGHPASEESKRKVSATLKKRGIAPPISRGEQQGSAKLTEKEVRAIRSASESTRVIAKQFGVSQQQVSRIRRHEAWAHVLDEEGS
jgi:GIY-YIG catalytic domain